MGASPSKESATANKALSAPTIAAYESQKALMSRVSEAGAAFDSEDKDRLRRFLEEAGLNDVSDFPKKLQLYTNENSLRATQEQVKLQQEINGLPRSGMAGAPDEANLLCLFLEMMNAKRVVEVGVFRGITTLALALCLRDMSKRSGEEVQRKVVGLDVSEEFAEVGKKHWKEAGVEDLIDFRVGDARESLSKLLLEEGYGESSVDLCFIDADKTSYDDYYEKCLKLTKPGGLIVVDNTLWAGLVLIPDDVLSMIETAKGKDGISEREVRFAQDAKAVKALNKKIHSDERVERVCFLTVADGVTICRKK